MVVTVRPAEELLQEYTRALLSHGDFAAFFTDDVVATMEGIEPQRFEGRDAVRAWIEGAHSLGTIRPKTLFACETQVGSEWEFVRKDGVVVPYAVIYDVRDDRISALRLFFTGPLM